ncbi:exonuclease domain-containing protein [Candidatus Thiothrix sp. Deng01]|uniref:Exonuclease domain-containing protein n=1 Tax=Candidatus Thiothrix phosphatis TaxID=3112415 RepID=A0ABU6CVH4_9GAMM|nr:exonuclease domain-containing protein [Candidatus Thiothrix sp. Deng01]MEB4590393.1 exonuclease domain-containing protein [Candidatus Thiothrix sp. Deng01]
MLWGWFSLEAQKQRLLPKVGHPVARRYLETPFADKKTPVEDLEYLVLDFETTGLDARKDAILSMGYTEIRQGRVQMGSCVHRIIKLNITLPPETVVVHKITDDRMSQGIHLHDALHELVERMTGKVLIAHFEHIERTFLQAAMERVYGCKMPLQILDTLEIEKRKREQLQQVIIPRQFRLGNLRQAYNLPRYGAHNALQDAIATAELFLAEMTYIQKESKGIRLTDLLG